MVPSFRVCAIQTAIDLAIDDERCSDARSNRHCQQAANVLANSLPILSQGCRVRVVFEDNRHLEVLAHRLAVGDVAPGRHGIGAQDSAPDGVHRSAGAHADPQDGWRAIVFEDLFHQVDGCIYTCLVCFWFLQPGSSEIDRFAFDSHQSNFDVTGAQVHPNHDGFLFCLRVILFCKLFGDKCILECLGEGNLV